MLLNCSLQRQHQEAQHDPQVSLSCPLRLFDRGCLKPTGLRRLTLPPQIKT